MKCSEFEEQLSAFLDGDLSASDREAATTHLDNCSECRQTTMIARGDYDLGPEDPPGDFVSEVLESTSGATCRHARKYLCTLADGELTAEYARVVESHLQACAECSGLFVGLTELAEVLPQMTLLEPDASFTSEVLCRTSAAEEVPLPSNRIQRLLDSIFQRPRSSWEAAYVGTLLLMTIWGSLATPAVLEKSTRRLASTQINLIRLADNLRQTAAESWLMRHSKQLEQELSEDYGLWRRIAVESLDAATNELHEFPEKSIEYLALKLRPALESISGLLNEHEQAGTERGTAQEPLTQ